MLPGPVFHIELLTTARRARYYFMRAFYAIILLYIVWQNYASAFHWYGNRSDQVSIQRISQFALTTFASLLIAQVIAVLVLTPTLTAGVIADEKQRKTLHYLLASRLSSAEIVLGKLLARLLHLIVFMTLVVPIISLMTLFGGIDPGAIGIAYVGLLSTTFFVAALGILVSTAARRVRDAIVTSYLLLAAILVIPLLFELVQFQSRPIYDAIEPLNRMLLRLNPFMALVDVGRSGIGTAGYSYEPLVTMVALHVGLGLAMTAVAVWRLRPIFRNQSDKVRKVTAGGRGRLRLFARPACGDDPMLWKEMHLQRGSALVRWSARLLYVVGLVFMGYWLVYLAVPAFKELLQDSYSGLSGGRNKREDFNGFLRFTVTFLYVIWGLGVAAAAGAGVTSEKEEDTWTSLTTTSLTGGEILGAKMIGAVWSMRWIGYIAAALVLLGLVLGSVHPFGAIAVTIEWAVYTLFVAALGVSFSLRSRNTTRATTGTVAALVFLNGGYLMCCIPFFFRSEGTPVFALGCSPAVVATSLMSYQDLWQALGWEQTPYYGPRTGEMALMCVLSVLAYGIGGAALLAGATAGFDRAIDRPMRGHLLVIDADKPAKPAATGVEDTA